MVRLDQGKSYCRPVEPPPEPPPYCTRSLGVADCWRDPASLPDHPPEMADGPRTLTPAQEADRTRGWPSLWATLPGVGGRDVGFGLSQHLGDGRPHRLGHRRRIIVRPA